MARPGGNPTLKKYQFKAAGEEPNNAKLSIWIPQSMKSKLDCLPNKNDVIRQAIAACLENLAQSQQETELEQQIRQMSNDPITKNPNPPANLLERGEQSQPNRPRRESKRHDKEYPS